MSSESARLPRRGRCPGHSLGGRVSRGGRGGGDHGDAIGGAGGGELRREERGEGGRRRDAGEEERSCAVVHGVLDE